MNMHAKITAATAVLAQLLPGQDYPDGNINARLHYTDDEIEELAASLKGPDGQLRPFLVATHPKKSGAYFVFGGGRRRIAYERLIGRGDLPMDHPIEIKDYGHISLEEALSKSLADNAAVQMHPADQAVTFARLVKDKAPVDIAQERGMTVKAVNGLIALGEDLEPEVLRSWREGKIKRDAVQMLVLADRKTQLEALADIEKHGNNPFGHTMRDWRREIMRNKEAVMTRLLGFVGIEAARAAGVIVTEDFFGKGGVVKDLGPLEKLANKKMRELEKAETAAGWSWVEGKITEYRFLHHGLSEQKVTPAYTADEKKRLAAIKARLEVLGEIDFHTPQQEGEESALELEAGKIEMDAKGRAYTAKQKASGGVIIKLRADGSVHYSRGVIRKAKPKAKTGGGTAPAAIREKDPITNAAQRSMQEWHNGAFGTLLAKKPRDAAALYIASIFYDGFDEVMELDTWGLKGKSKDLVGLFARMRKMTDAKLVEALVPAALENLSIADHSGALSKNGQALVKHLSEKDYQAALAKQFKPKDYFDGASKKHLLGVMAEAFNETARGHAEDKSESQIVQIFVAEIGRTGWLPPEMRTKAYSGPSAKSPAKAKAEALDKGRKAAKKKGK